MKVTGDSSHIRNPQVKSQNPSIILHKKQKNSIIVCAKLIHTNYVNLSGSNFIFTRNTIEIARYHILFFLIQ